MEYLNRFSHYWNISIFIWNVLIFFILNCGTRTKLEDKFQVKESSFISDEDNNKLIPVEQRVKKNNSVDKIKFKSSIPEKRVAKLLLTNKQKLKPSVVENRDNKPFLIKKKQTHNILEYYEKKERQKSNRNAFGRNKLKSTLKKCKNLKNDKVKNSLKDIQNKKNDLNKPTVSKQGSVKLVRPIVFEQIKDQEIREKQLLDLVFHDVNTTESTSDYNKNYDNESKKKNKVHSTKNSICDINSDTIKNEPIGSRINERETSTASDETNKVFQNEFLKEAETKMVLKLKNNSQNQEKKCNKNIEETLDEPIIDEKLGIKASKLLKVPPPPLNGSSLVFTSAQQKNLVKKSIRDFDKEKLQKALKLKIPRVFLNKTQNSKSVEATIEKNGSKEIKTCVDMEDIVEE